MPGVGVPVPGAADVVAGLEDDEIVEAGPGQFDRRSDTGETGADHHDLVVGGLELGFDRSLGSGSGHGSSAFVVACAPVGIYGSAR